MKLKRILGLSLASIFIISQSVLAISTGNFTNKDDDFSDIFSYTEYYKVVNPNDPVTIPDPQLKALINKTLDASRKETQDVTKKEMESLKELKSTLKDGTKYIISDLSGLEYAINLNSLFIWGDSKNKLELKNVKVIQNLASLINLLINGYNLLTIDLSKNANLQFLDLSNNNLSTIDLSKNTQLVNLSLNSNNLSTIDVRKNTKLTNFEAENQIINANLDNITLQGDKVIIKNEVSFDGTAITDITGSGVNYDLNTNLLL